MKRSRHSASNDGSKLAGPRAQQRIEDIIASIPPGRVCSYGRVADLAGLPGRARLVARTLRTTRRELPWFRVLRANGQIAIDPADPAHSQQIRLLRAEGVKVSGSRVNLDLHGWNGAVADLLALQMWEILEEFEAPESGETGALVD